MTTALMPIPEYVPALLAEKMVADLLASGGSAATAKERATTQLPGVLAELQRQIDSKAEGLQPGEEMVIRWDEADVRIPEQSPASAALFDFLTNHDSKARSAPSGTVTLSAAQFEQLAAVVAQAAASGAIQGVQTRQDSAKEIESQDIPVPGQLGRFKKRVTTRRVPSNSLRDLR